MLSRFKALTVATVVAVSTITLTGIPQANAATDRYAFVTSAGGTQISAVGATIISDLTAESSVAGIAPASDTNKVASVRVAGLAQVGAVTTEAKAETASTGKGFKTTAHAHTANISLLNGAIEVSAVDTTSVSTSRT